MYEAAVQAGSAEQIGRRSLGMAILLRLGDPTEPESDCGHPYRALDWGSAEAAPTQRAQRVEGVPYACLLCGAQGECAIYRESVPGSEGEEASREALSMDLGTASAGGSLRFVAEKEHEKCAVLFYATKRDVAPLRRSKPKR